ncbi:MAG TPA: 2-amino-4-hydroxy-6-hydroxymethyldihydropteridine diphosphokinase [Pyrinomonadaceae bacterium]|jgi:2-amino-4-hydroxy-6-hydroxymethyldihydropteridine diphosphokinase
MILDYGHQTPDSLKAYVSLGSNLGERAGNLLLAVRGMLDAGLKVARLSSIYETEPVGAGGGGGGAQPTFLNMVAEIEHVELFSPEQMLARLLRIEYALGRRRDVPHGPRTIDLDLLLYGDEQRATPFLTLPHPRLHERRFVLVPLAELVPSLLHPSLHKTFSQLLAQAQDASEVRRWQP